MKYDVIIFGGGISGLTLSHELVKKGLKILVIDKDIIFGGMARSNVINGIPAEHSWRGCAPIIHTIYTEN